ncbi:MAG: hypothetical protein ACQESP_01060 [Candidatus Muiribacteriota bacterium]
MSNENLLDDLIKMDKASSFNNEDKEELAILKKYKKKPESNPVEEDESLKKTDDEVPVELLEEPSAFSEAEEEEIVNYDDILSDFASKEVYQEENNNKDEELEKKPDKKEKNHEKEEVVEIPENIEFNKFSDLYNEKMIKKADKRIVLEVKKVINSFLELLITKNGNVLYIDSDSYLSLVLNTGHVETEKNKLFNFKALNSYIDYIIPGVQKEEFIKRNVFRTQYSYINETFNVLVFREDKNVKLSFSKIEKISNVILPVVNSIDYTSVINRYKGTINIISGFKEEYSVEVSKQIADKLADEFKNVFLIYENNKFDLSQRGIIYSTLNKNTTSGSVIKGIVQCVEPLIFYEAELSEQNLNNIIETAFLGKNVFFIMNSRNSASEIVEFFLSSINNPMKKRLFAKYLNSILSINILYGHNYDKIPVYEYVYFDKKLKRNLLEAKYDSFFRELLELNNENIITFEKSLNRSVASDKISRSNAQKFLNNFVSDKIN